MKRSSAFSCQGRFLNKGSSCWLGCLLQGFFSSTVLHGFLACHKASCPNRRAECPLCALATTEEQSRNMDQILALEPLWPSIEEGRGLSWAQQQDPLEFCLQLCSMAHRFFAVVLGARLTTTVVQDLPCQCGVEMPPAHTFPSTQEYIVPINVPEPDIAVPLVALADLIVMMTTDTPENLTQCPLCVVQAGFHASHCWAYGPVVVFHLVPQARPFCACGVGPKSVFGWSFLQAPSMCVPQRRNQFWSLCCLCSASCDASMGAVQ